MMASFHYKFCQHLPLTSSTLVAFLTSSIVVCVLSSTASATTHSSHRSLPTMYFPDACAATAVSGFTEGLIVSQRSTKYHPNMACTMYINVRSFVHVRFTFDFIDLPETSDGDCEDYLQFYVGDVDGDWTAIGQQICGRTPPNDIISHSANVSVVFKTNSAVEGTGFRFRFLRHKQPKEVCAPGRGCVLQNNEVPVSSFNGSSEEKGGVSFLVLFSLIAFIVVLLRRSHVTQCR